MIRSTRVLYKLFVKSYYRAHASQILVFFTLFGVYFFFTPVLKDSLLSFSEKVYHNLLLTISVVSEPLFAGLFAVFFVIFLIRVNKYIKELLPDPQYTFLFYSINSLQKSRQLLCWVLVSLGISLPFLVFIVFSVVVGIVKGYYLIPLVLLCLAGVGVTINSVLLVNRLNSPRHFDSASFLSSYITGWKKPLFAMFPLYAAEKLTGTFFLSKSLSLLLIFAVYFLFREDMNNYQLNAVCGLLAAVSNAYLLFEENRFNTMFLSFYRNLPVPAYRVFLQISFMWMLLLLPEMIAFAALPAYRAPLFSVALLLFFRAILLTVTQDFKRYFYGVLLLFLVLFIAILFKVFGLLVIVCFAISCKSVYSNR
ncbi:hypothetical protein [Leadbetterella sp. DM7]|uniref:hypothetical protein n=1 Tax=Leadbetterella sp. DM7 TaxID=3235085 RepID=UPI00349EF6C5